MRDCLIYCRALDELRRVFGPRRDSRQMFKFFVFLLSVPLSIFVMSQVYHFMVESVRPHLRLDGSSAFGPLAAGVIGMGTLFFLGTTSELFREIGSAKDCEFLQLCPIEPLRLATYRVVFTFARTTTFSLAFMLFPFYYICSIYSSGHALVLLTVFACFFPWTLILALWVVVCILSMQILPLSRKVILVTFNIAMALISCFIFYSLMDRASWNSMIVRFRCREPSYLFLLLMLLFFVTSGYGLFRHVLHLWPAIRKEEVGGGRLRFLRLSGAPFSEKSCWAILQKDFRDLIRNPAYKYSLVASLLFFPLVLLAQWKAGVGEHPSWRRMWACLALLYMEPLMISARTAALELRMLGFYRLILPKLEYLLDLKWRAQAVLNCLIVALLTFPYFLFVRQGPKPFEPAYFAGCVVVYVPILTMLAIALGTFFPARTISINPIGMNKWGIILYASLAIVLYSFLLNYMFLGILIYSVFLIPLTLLLYLGARRYLFVLCGQ
jgi:hypothetical protein